ncbi:MAG: FtsX-like permease family protein [Myxococcota bacterium]|jgi:ABC-type lipoprotein release transport system permease subunit|nr:FtsX-like permease family protein [Myxococcota bacterium]
MSPAAPSAPGPDSRLAGLRRRAELLLLLVRLALRNLLASRLKTLIVGGIILFGAVIVVVGTALLDSIDQSMRRSIVGSLAGDLQVYSSASKDELALYGGMTGDPDLAPFPDYSQVKQALQTLPNVRAVVPMGIAEAAASAGNVLDRALERLRDTVRRQQAGDPDPELPRRLAAELAHVRRIVELVQADQQETAALQQESTQDAAAQADLARALAPAFWEGFHEDPLLALEFLENRIAPQALEGTMLWVRYVGTDPEAFATAFHRLEIIQGTAIPRGQRGILLGNLYYEDWCKLKTARRLDRIREKMQVNQQKLAQDEELQRWARESLSQIGEITKQLDPEESRQAVARLQQALPSATPELPALLRQLLTVTDDNFEKHYRIFYEQLAPLLDLYSVRLGESLTIKAFTRSGYLKSVNVRVWGIFQFRGLEKSTFAGYLSVMDLMSFRDLYGYLTADKAEEIRELKAAAGARPLARDEAEAALFGAPPAPGEPGTLSPEAGSPGPTLLVATSASSVIDEEQMLQAGGGGDRRQARLASRVYSPAEIEQGVALNVAVFLKDPSRTAETIQAITELGRARGLPLRAVDWQQAAGMVGQFITLSRLVLLIAVLIIFLIALVIINNAMVIATLQRVQEIGTLRAIGAQRRLILAMLFVEATAVGLLFGLLGALTGAGIIRLIGWIGIPASTDVLYFFFSGPRLHPTLAAGNVVLACGIVLVVSILSSFYPAWLAMRITPRAAMQREE